LHQAEQARADLVRYDGLMTELSTGTHAYMAEGTAVKIERDEMLAWAAFAEGKQVEALTNMRAAADLQDKVGQGEVDIPAREMLADMQLEFGHPQQALTEYEVALKLSPNRLNGLYNAGKAAEAGRRESEGEDLLRCAAKIDQQRRELRPFRVRPRQELRILSTAGGQLALTPGRTGWLLGTSMTGSIR
jgi:tetratricopeptide (TPR) repeat protein